MEKAFTFFKKFPATHVFHRLPKHYKNQVIHLKEEQPLPVHYVPHPKEWIKDPVTGLKKRVVNVPIPLIDVKEADDGLWGGEGVIKGLKKHKAARKKFLERIPHFWVPVLQRSVLYSEILDKHMSTIVTKRTLDLIDEYFGLDNYILKSRHIDLRSSLAMSLKREMLFALANKTLYPDDPEKRTEIYDKYKQFIIPVEEIEWIGLSLSEAFKKQYNIEAAAKAADYPLKNKYRLELIKSLKESQVKEGEEPDLKYSRKDAGWLNKLNPFSKSEASPKS